MTSFKTHQQPKSASKLQMRFFVIGIFCISFSISLFIAHNSLTVHFPMSDDLSMIAFSQNWTWEWFTKGLADYFIVYPEYYNPQSNFIRPVSNLLYWAFGNLIPGTTAFQADTAQLVILNYGTHAAITALITTEVLRISKSYSLSGLALIFGILIPTFWTTPTTTYSSFVFDGLATLFCLSAYRFIRSGHPLAAAFILTPALLTKEIAFPVALAFVLYFTLVRQFTALWIVCVAIALWTCLRFYAFGLHLEGVYVFSDQSIDFVSFIKVKIQNILTLPLGPILYDEIAADRNAIWIEKFSEHPRTYLLLICNFILYSIIGICIAITSLRAVMQPFRMQKQYQPTKILLLSATFLSFLFVAYIGANYRYAYIFLPFLLISMAEIIHLPKLRMTFFIVLAFGSCVASSNAIARLYKGNQIENYRYKVIRELILKLQATPSDRPIVLVNDFVSGYANPDALKILMGTQINIVRGTSLYLDSCNLDDLKKINTDIAALTNQISLKTGLPDCGRFAFESSPRIGLFMSDQKIERNSNIEYKYQRRQNSRGRSIDQIGQELTIRLANFNILYFDFQSESWTLVKP